MTPEPPQTEDRIMNAAAQRNWARGLHIAAGAVIGTYIYSPWGSDPAFVLAVKVGLVPLVGLSGVFMWKQAALGRALRRRRDRAA